MQREAQRSRRDQGQREVLLSPPWPLAPPSQSLSPGSWEVWGVCGGPAGTGCALQPLLGWAGAWQGRHCPGVTAVSRGLHTPSSRTPGLGRGPPAHRTGLVTLRTPQPANPRHRVSGAERRLQDKDRTCQWSECRGRRGGHE